MPVYGCKQNQCQIQTLIVMQVWRRDTLQRRKRTQCHSMRCGRSLTRSYLETHELKLLCLPEPPRPDRSRTHTEASFCQRWLDCCRCYLNLLLTARLRNVVCRAAASVPPQDLKLACGGTRLYPNATWGPRRPCDTRVDNLMYCSIDALLCTAPASYSDESTLLGPR